MKIQYKLSLTFILLLIFGVTAISSYTIMSVRAYLLSQGEENLINDARLIQLVLQNEIFENDGISDTRLNQFSGYEVAIYDITGNRIRFFGEPNLTQPTLPDDLTRKLSQQNSTVVTSESDNQFLFVYNLISRADGNRILAVGQSKEVINQPVRTMRWIVYSGMFISISIILFVSFIFSKYLSQPIMQLTDASRKIADGDTDYTINLEREDEFGTLADSLNQMSAKLRADNEQLKLASEKQRQFYADIAHEIRNPLHTIMGTLEMMQMDGIAEDKRQKFSKSAMSQADRINRLFKDLMTLQRSDLDQNFIAEKRFRIDELIKKSGQTFQGIAQDKGIDLSCKAGKHHVTADPDKIEQVLDNLISNALKYTPAGSVTISAEKDGGKVRVEVKDTGIGIPKDHHPRLFDRFYRTDKARSRDSGGTGLGLAVVKSILDAHGSEIGIESEPGKGTKIWFHLNAG